MKVLLVTETLYEGGSQLFVIRLARKLLQVGVNVTVLSLNKVHENRDMMEQYEDIPIIRLSLPFLFVIEKIDHYLLRLGIDFSLKYFLQRKQIRRRGVHKFDIIHTHYIQVDWLFASLNKKNKWFKHIVTVHGDYSAHWQKEKLKQGRVWLNLKSKMQLIIDRVDKWVMIAEEQISFFKNDINLDKGKWVKIYNGFESTHTPPIRIKHDHFTVGMISRGVSEKGWELLIKEFVKLPPDCRLLLAGYSDYVDGLKKKYACVPNIIFAGFQPDPLNFISQLDIMIFPTLLPFEALPTVITEALYCSIPVIATNVGEVEKMITDKETRKMAGYVIDFDGKNLNEVQLYQRMKYFYDNPEKILEMSITAHEAFKKFNMDKCAKDYLQEYQNLLS
ncbi:MAG TPA: glycosyltransferase family 4 protein [Chitinophagaceae bacterium]